MNTSKFLPPRIGLRGRVQVAVCNPVRGDRIYPCKPNLILDQGLDEIGVTLICNIFRVAVKGVGIGGVTTDTFENVDNANSYTMNSGSHTLTRVAGTRDFTADDVGKLVKFDASGFETTITAYTDATHVEATPAPTVTKTAQDIHLYFVQQVGLEGEVGRTVNYAMGANENLTTTVDDLRTFKRTFIFPAENTLIETPEFTNFYSQTGTTVTRTQGARDFTGGDVGKMIHYRTSNWNVTIVSITGVSEVEVDISLTAPEQCIDLLEEDSMSEVPAGSNTYSRSGTTVARDAGARDFSAADVGKIIYFIDDNVEATIVTYTNPGHVEVNTSGAISTQNIELYEFKDYSEVGFSHSEETGDNLNIRVKLASAVRVNGASRLAPSDQLKVIYELELVVSPAVETTGTLNSVINDPGGDMSGNKNGKYAIESFATSTVAASGETVSTFAYLEPSIAGYLALSLDDDAIDPLGTPERNSGVSFVPFEADAYTDGDFFRTYRGVFGLNDAVGANWRSLMLYDPNTDNAIFTFRFNNPQTKDSGHTLSLTLTKTWGRVL